MHSLEALLAELLLWLRRGDDTRGSPHGTAGDGPDGGTAPAPSDGPKPRTRTCAQQRATGSALARIVGVGAAAENKKATKSSDHQKRLHVFFFRKVGSSDRIIGAWLGSAGKR